MNRYHTGRGVQTYKFNTRKQKSDESIDEIVATLKTLAKSCNFCKCVNLKDSSIRDRLVLGVNNLASKARLLLERLLTLQTVSTFVGSSYNASSELKMLPCGENNSAEIHKMNKFSAKQMEALKMTTRFCRLCHHL